MLQCAGANIRITINPYKIKLHTYVCSKFTHVYPPWLFDLLVEWIPLSWLVRLLSPAVNAEDLHFVISASTTTIINVSIGSAKMSSMHFIGVFLENGCRIHVHDNFQGMSTFYCELAEC